MSTAAAHRKAPISCRPANPNGDSSTRQLRRRKRRLESLMRRCFLFLLRAIQGLSLLRVTLRVISYEGVVLRVTGPGARPPAGRGVATSWAETAAECHNTNSNTCVCMYIYIYTYIYIYIYIYVYMCMCVYIYIYMTFHLAQIYIIVVCTISVDVIRIICSGRVSGTETAAECLL